MTPFPAAAEIAVALPFHAEALLQFLAARAVPGVEAVSGRSYGRTLALPGGPAVIRLDFPGSTDGSATVAVTMYLSDPADEATVIARCRHLIGAEVDAAAAHEALSSDPSLADVVRRNPGIRVPGAVDGPEILIRALIGQQVSVAAARTKLAQLTAITDERLPPELVEIATGREAGGFNTAGREAGGFNTAGREAGGFNTAGRGGVINSSATSGEPAPPLTHLFPSPGALAALAAVQITGPRGRAETIIAAAVDMAEGTLDISHDRAHADLTADLVARRGIGPWTAGYVAMRVLAEPDILLTGDLALRNGAAALGFASDPKELSTYGRRWSPYRSFAGMYLWRSCPPPTRKPRRRR